MIEVWTIWYGEYPNLNIDHIDHNKTNNTITNLRLVTQSENNKNASSSKSKLPKGVRKTKYGKYQSSISVGGEYLYLGTSDTLEEAATVRWKAEEKYGYHPNHGKGVCS